MSAAILPPRPGPDAPEITFAIASYNAMPFLEQAVHSALAQQGVTVEVVIVDDGSSDGSRECARALASADPRVRVLATKVNSGPGGARNLAIDDMRGEWLAVLDSDDEIDPARSKTLLDAARSAGADIVADDLLLVSQGAPDTTFLDPGWSPSGEWLDLDRYIADSALFGSAPNPGFLKPMFHCRIFEQGKNRYNPDLRVAEDDELIVRLLLDGYRYLVLPEPLYRYRKHEASMTHRLSADHASRMVASERRLRRCMKERGRVPRSYRRRWRSVNDTNAFVRSVEHLKNRDFPKAFLTLLLRPTALRLYSMPLAALARKLTGRLGRSAGGDRQ